MLLVIILIMNSVFGFLEIRIKLVFLFLLYLIIFDLKIMFGVFLIFWKLKKVLYDVYFLCFYIFKDIYRDCIFRYFDNIFF